jgi:hypothetical protein
LFNQIIVFMAYFGPYFALPAAFRLAGGAIAQIGGIANDRSKGFFDRNKKFRETHKAVNRNKMRNFGYFSEKYKVGRAANAALGTAYNPRAAGGSLREGNMNRIRSARQAGRATLGADSFKNDPTVMANQNDDNFLIALADEEWAQKKLAAARTNRSAHAVGTDEYNKYHAEVQARERGLAAAGNVASKNTMATRMQALQSLAATGYQFDDDKDGYDELSESVKKITGGDQGAYAAAMNQAQYNLKNAGRFDLAGINNGAGYDREKGLNKADIFTVGRAKAQSTGSFGKAAEELFAAGEREKAAKYRLELEAIAQSGHGEARDTAWEEIRRLDTAAPGLKAWMDAPTGRPTQKRINWNPTSTPPSGAGAWSTWSADDQKRGWRTETMPETNRDAAHREARTARIPREDE